MPSSPLSAPATFSRLRPALRVVAFVIAAVAVVASPARAQAV
ncbi:hypothetical protein AcdelDRAFT_3953, partial [Acidovorax delafieldii 2AN]